MKRFFLIFLVATWAVTGAASTVTCKIDDKSVIGHSPSGIPQVSNMAEINVICSASPGRALPTKPGEMQYPLRARTLAVDISGDSPKTVDSSTDTSGGDRSEEQERMLFQVHIPLDKEELHAEIRRFLDNFEKVSSTLPTSVGDRQKEKTRLEYLREHLDEMAPMVQQHRIGVYKVECQIRDVDELKGTSQIEFEVVFRGRFSDGPLQMQAPAKKPVVAKPIASTSDNIYYVK